MSVKRITHYGLPFANVTATGVATAPFTPGRTMEKITLELGGTALTKAMITLLKLKANGKVFLECDASTLDKLNAYRGRAVSANFLDIYFKENRGLTEFDRMVGAFDTTQGINNITAEVTIAGATAPTLQSILSETAAQKSQTGAAAPFAGVMHKLLRYPFNTSVGGTLPVSLPFGPVNGAVIKRIHVAHGGNVTGMKVKQDGLVLHESIQAENAYEQTQWGLVPQTNIYTVDFVIDGDMSKAFDTRDAKSVEWLLTLSAADSGYIYVEYLDTLGNL